MPAAAPKSECPRDGAFDKTLPLTLSWLDKTGRAWPSREPSPGLNGFLTQPFHNEYEFTYRARDGRARKEGYPIRIRMLALAAIALMLVAFPALAIANNGGAALTVPETQSSSVAQAESSTAPDTEVDEDTVDEDVQDGPDEDTDGQDGPDEDADVQNSDGATFVGSIKVVDPEPTDLTTLAKITAEQAGTAAVATALGATVTKVDLDAEDGYLVYTVELDNGTEVTVDAGDGTVLLTENQSDTESENETETGG